MIWDCCCIDVHNGPSVSSCRDVRARKGHRCCECEGMISPGETYELVKGCWDGGWQAFKTCRSCAAIRRDFFKCGFHYNCLAEELSECYGIDLVSTERTEV